MPRSFLVAAAATTTATLALALLSGCGSAAADDVGNAEAAATPENPRTHWELSQMCVRMLKRHEAVRSVDMAEGVIRWGCGDVPGVTNEDLGQEYCEYQVVQNGAIKRKASEIAEGGGASCVFTSVFQDATAGARLEATMAKPENLGVAVGAPAIVQMQKPFNSRGAASALVRDCQNADPAYPLERRLRTAACHQAIVRSGSRTGELPTLCKTDLMTDTVWARAQELGAKIVQNGEDGFEEQRDISSCMVVAAAGGVMWRNSDPMICSRTSRSATECSCEFNPVPDALEGLQFTGWVDDQIPPGCRFAKEEGKDYPNVVICSVSDQELSDIPLNPLYANNLGNFCRDRFAIDLVMKLPIRAIQAEGTCKETAGFCKEYMGTPAAPEPTEPGTTEPGTTEPGTTPPTPTPAPTTPVHRVDGAPEFP